MVCVLVVAIYFNSCHFILHLIDVNEHTRDKSGSSGERDTCVHTQGDTRTHTRAHTASMETRNKQQEMGKGGQFFGEMVK